jgi:hypothetical protein
MLNRFVIAVFHKALGFTLLPDSSGAMFLVRETEST